MKKPVDRECKTHDEEGAVKDDAKLSGSTYVSIRLRGEDHLGRSAIGRLLIRDPLYCAHGVTICVECADSWEIDYSVYYDRTAGGRRLADARAARSASTTRVSVEGGDAR